MNQRGFAMHSRPRAILIAIGLAFALPACTDVGLRDNIPLEEARNRPFRYSTYTMTQRAAHSFEQQTWVQAGEPIGIPDRLLVPLPGSADLFALAWDAPPRSRLYTATPDGWLPLAPAH